MSKPEVDPVIVVGSLIAEAIVEAGTRIADGASRSGGGSGRLLSSKETDRERWTSVKKRLLPSE